MMPVIYAVDQLFYIKERDGKTILFVAEEVNNFLRVGTGAFLDHFINKFNSRFELSHINKGFNIKLLKFTVLCNPQQKITLSMSDYMTKLLNIDIPSNRNAKLNESALAQKILLLLQHC